MPQLHPFYLNWFENIAAIQFDHRVLAVSPPARSLLLWAAGRRSALPKPARIALHALLAAAALQVALGISTLILVVPIPLAAAHQAGAVLLLTAAIVVRAIPCAGPLSWTQERRRPYSLHLRARETDDGRRRRISGKDPRRLGAAGARRAARASRSKPRLGDPRGHPGQAALYRRRSRRDRACGRRCAT